MKSNYSHSVWCFARNAALDEAGYKALQAADAAIGDEFRDVLTAAGKNAWMVCPHCGHDEFTHEDGCDLAGGEDHVL